MPIGYTVDHGQGLLFVRGWGTLTDASLRVQAQAMQSDARMDPTFKALVDLRGVTVHEVTLGLLQRFPTSIAKAARRATVVGDVVGLAKAQAYSGWVAGEGSAIVTRDLEEALEWLELPLDTELPDQLDETFGTHE